MKVLVTALVGMLAAVGVSQQLAAEPVWNDCEPLMVQPEDGERVVLPAAQYRVVDAEPLTVEYLGTAAQADRADPVRGTAVVAGLRCDP